ncbi:hypothetical protein TTHERM_00370670 (macronuclear) [Tetrahymena thermophila SB210]|uniref:Uncharacterized protein n=1 Tax=Tetrahymena thermophila (strain SB210) TaxID=312017 RepID=I7M726_TETTS|nr:hypothetical protein TTHERM_00370670 [Tetrahymena thermophila SB210]EAR89252.2 hypothetical protein TTHERM_00370670 [Tetrahymena thermophila SB210]|eukprot:XP_001009497.2 hypothetical protein TTHERM_00370670 [Tetrahymena thermophila SB210]
MNPQKQQNQKINIRHLTESQYKKSKNIPSQELPRKCQPDAIQPINLLMIPKPQVSIANLHSNAQMHEQKQIQANNNIQTNTVTTITRTSRTLSFNSSLNTGSSQIYQNQNQPIQHKVPFLQTQQSSGNLANPLLQSGTLNHQRHTSCNNSTILSENSQRGIIFNAPNQGVLAHQYEELMASNKELRNQLNQERETSKQMYEALQKAQVEIKNKESQMNQFIEQQRSEIKRSYDQEIQIFKETILKQEQQINSLQDLSAKKNENETNRFEERVALLTTELERLQQIINEKNSMISKLEEKTAMFTQEIERLKLMQNEKNQVNLKLEEKCAIFTQEINRLQMIIQSNQKQVQEASSQELQKYEERVYILEQEKLTIIQDVHKLAEESQRLNEINSKLEEKVAGFSTEIDRLNMMLQSRQNQYEERVTNLTVEIERLNALIQQRTTHFEEKIVQLTTEITHLNESKNILIIEKQNLMNDYKNKHEDKIGQMTQEISRLNQVICQLEGQVAENEETVKRSKHTHKDVLDQERANFELINTKQNHRIIELENEKKFAQMEIQRLQERINDAQMERDKSQSAELALNREIENLQCINNSRQREIETLHERIRVLEKEGEQRVSEMKSHYEMMRQSHITREVQELTIKFNSERKQFETQISNQFQNNRELENNLQIITAETDRLRQLCETKTKEIEELKQTELLQQNKMETYIIQIQKLNSDLQDSKNQLVVLQEEMQRQFERQKQIELEQFERELRRDFSEQYGQLNYKLQDMSLKYEESLVAYVLQSTEFERIKDQNEKLWEDNCVLQQKEEQIKIEFQEEFTLYKVEIERANREKLEIELKEIYEKIEFQQQQYNNELNKQQTELHNQQNEINRYQNELNAALEQIKELHDNKDELENKIVMLSTENNRLVFMIQEKDKKMSQLEVEINHLRETDNTQQSELNAALLQRKELQDNIQELENKIVMLSTENNRLVFMIQEKDKKISQQEVEINHLRETDNTQQNELNAALLQRKELQDNIQELENKIVMLSTENNRLAFIIQEKDKKLSQQEVEINNLREKAIQLEMKIKENESLKQIQVQQQCAIEEYVQHIEKLNSQIDQLNRQIQEIQNQFFIDQEELHRQHEFQRQSELEQLERRLKGQFEQQLSALNDTFTDLEDKYQNTLVDVVLKTAELERMNELNNKLQQDISDLLTNQNEMEIKFEQEFTVYKQTAEREKQQKVDSERKQIQEKLEAQQQQYNQEINRKQQELKYALEQTRNLESNVEEYEKRVTIITQESNKLLSIVEDRENRIRDLETELNNIRGKSNQISQLKQAELTLQHKIEILQLQNQKLMNDYQECQRQSLEMQIQLSQKFEEQKRVEMEQFEIDFKKDFNEKYEILQKEFNKLFSKYQECLINIVLITAELEKIKDQNEKLWEDNMTLQQREGQFQEEFTAYKMEVEKNCSEKLESELKEIYQKIEYQQQQYCQQINVLQQDLNQANDNTNYLQSLIKEQENKIVLLSTENQRLHYINQGRENLGDNNQKEQSFDLQNEEMI